MTVLLTSTSQSALELVSALDPVAPAAWARSALSTSWGCVAWAGEHVRVVDEWLVLGLPSADPWGWPGHRLEAENVVHRLSLFGPDAVRTATGPFLVLDMRDGSVTRPGNGLVPFWTAGDLSSTHRELAGSSAVEQCPLAHSGYERLTRTALNGRRIRAELLEHRPPGTLDLDALVPGPLDRLWRRGAHAAARLRMLRHEAAQRWWSSRLDGRWLHAPVLERPVVDRLLMVGS